MLSRLALAAAFAPLLVADHAAAEVAQCHVVDVKFTPAIAERTAEQRHEPSQIVAWVETPNENYIDTVFITRQTGRFGLGNRPGRFDFNSGPMLPYGRRITTFPVWAHQHGLTFDGVVFRNCCGTSPRCRRRATIRRSATR